VTYRVELAPRARRDLRSLPHQVQSRLQSTPTRTPEPEEGIEREGTVGSITGTSFVLMTGSGPVTVQTNSATLFRKDGSPASFADIKVGGEVQAEGALQADGSLAASRVSIK
jgi:hypothetical protein